MRVAKRVTLHSHRTWADRVSMPACPVADDAGMTQVPSATDPDLDLPPWDASDPKPPTPPARVVLYLVAGLLAAFILLSVVANLSRPDVGPPAEAGESAVETLAPSIPASDP
jgi:hypothetical protein